MKKYSYLNRTKFWNMSQKSINLSVKLLISKFFKSRFDYGHFAKFIMALCFFTSAQASAFDENHWINGSVDRPNLTY